MAAVAGRVVSVNVGRPRKIEHRGRPRTTAIWKEPVDGRVVARGVNLDGDGQADRRVHGGPDKAVYAYACDDYAWWEGLLGRPLPPGTFGENLTVDGMDLGAAVVGERWRVGSVELEVCQPRTPCWKLGVRMGDEGFPDLFEEVGRLGAYLRITGEGELGAGDDVLLAHRPGHGVTLDLVRRAFDDPSLFPAVLAAPELPERLRAQMAAPAR